MSDKKNDPVLGWNVHEHLLKVGVETPGVGSDKIPLYPLSIRKEVIENSFKVIMETLGLDLLDDSLQDTPKRVAKMYVDEIFWGLDPSNFPKATTVKNKMGYDEMVLEREVAVRSNCEHHFVIIDGVANVAYIPKDKVLGLSKINRIVDYFSRRPQIQERLTEQVYHALSYILDTPDIAVMIKASHHCVKSRGIKDANSYTITSKLGGCFKDEPSARAEFMRLSTF